MTLGLIGYRGSGKTTVGRAIARRLDMEFVDTDELIVHEAGKTIKEIFEQHGEPAFRDLESQAVHQSIRLPNAVISFGGGALDREENRQSIRAGDCRLVYLRCEPAELLRRIHADTNTAANRPNLTTLGGGIDEIQLVLNRREPIWRAMVFAEIDVTCLTIDQVVDQLAILTVEE